MKGVEKDKNDNVEMENRIIKSEGGGRGWGSPFIERHTGDDTLKKEEDTLNEY